MGREDEDVQVWNPSEWKRRFLSLPKRTQVLMGVLGTLVGLSLLTSAGLYLADTDPPREKNGVQWLTREEVGTFDSDVSCPVMDEPAKAGFSVSYKGKVYHLCCKKCVRAFQANPEKYIEGGEHHRDEEDEP